VARSIFFLIPNVLEAHGKRRLTSGETLRLAHWTSKKRLGWIITALASGCRHGSAPSALAIAKSQSRRQVGFPWILVLLRPETNPLQRRAPKRDFSSIGGQTQRGSHSMNRLSRCQTTTTQLNSTLRAHRYAMICEAFCREYCPYCLKRQLRHGASGFWRRRTIGQWEVLFSAERALPYTPPRDTPKYYMPAGQHNRDRCDIEFSSPK